VTCQVQVPTYADVECPVMETKCTPEYRDVEVPVYACRDVPVFAQRCVPQYDTVEVPVYGTRNVPTYTTRKSRSTRTSRFRATPAVRCRSPRRSATLHR